MTIWTRNTKESKNIVRIFQVIDEVGYIVHSKVTSFVIWVVMFLLGKAAGLGSESMRAFVGKEQLKATSYLKFNLRLLILEYSIFDIDC